MDFPLVVEDAHMGQALELLSWMVAHDFLEVKVAVPCDPQGNPVPDGGLFHEKSGVIEDRAGYKIAWTGSLNETAGGWRRNWETINVSTSWDDPSRVALEEANFEHVWAGPRSRWIVLDVPDAVRRNLLQFLPEDGARPKRLRDAERKSQERTHGAEPTPKAPESPEDAERRAKVWDFIRKAPTLPDGGSLVGEATSAVTPWPHQVRAFERMYESWPPRLLIADEVGLGKTIQAGMLIRQAWIAQRAKRVLILAPKAVLGQWQVELREKFNLNWPIYDQGRLTWYGSPAMAGRNQRTVAANAWHRESAVIASSQLMRRQERATELLAAKPWDLVVLDEAHHARRRGAAGSAREEDRPNALLALMRELRHRTEGLLLLTATPMQVDPVEVWDLLNLLEMPDEWTARDFTRFFSDVTNPDPSATAMESMAALFRAAEAAYGPMVEARAQRLTELSVLGTKKVLRALRDRSGIPRRRLNAGEKAAAVAMVRSHTPISQQVSRHTRDLLRRYFEAGMLETPIAAREVDDRFIEMPDAERAVYEAVEDYIASTYNQADESVRNAVGFIMTVYRRRLASSFAALRATLRKRLEAVELGAQALTETDEDIPDDEAGDEALDAEEVTDLSRQALLAEERASIAELLASVEELAPDTKLDELLRDAGRAPGGRLRAGDGVHPIRRHDGFLARAALGPRWASVSCATPGRGGEVPLGDQSDAWRVIPRDDAKRRFREGEAGGAAVYGRGGRGPQLPVLRRPRQLRHAMEPNARRAKNWPHRPPGPDSTPASESSTSSTTTRWKTDVYRALQRPHSIVPVGGRQTPTHPGPPVRRHRQRRPARHGTKPPGRFARRSGQSRIPRLRPRRDAGGRRIDARPPRTSVDDGLLGGSNRERPRASRDGDAANTEVRIRPSQRDPVGGDPRHNRPGLLRRALGQRGILVTGRSGVPKGVRRLTPTLCPVPNGRHAVLGCSGRRIVRCHGRSISDPRKQLWTDPRCGG